MDRRDDIQRSHKLTLQYTERVPAAHQRVLLQYHLSPFVHMPFEKSGEEIPLQKVLHVIKCSGVLYLWLSPHRHASHHPNYPFGIGC